MKDHIYLCLEEWPYGVTALAPSKGRDYRSAWIPLRNDEGQIWQKICEHFSIKTQVQCVLIWPAFATELRHKKWPKADNPRIEKRILANYMLHEEKMLAHLPNRIDQFDLKSGFLWQILWPERELYREVIQRLGLDKEKVKLLSFSCLLNRKKTLLDTILEVDVRDGSLLGQMREEGLLLWPARPDPLTLEGQESIDLLLGEFGGIPSSGEEAVWLSSEDILDRDILKKCMYQKSTTKYMSPLLTSSKKRILAVTGLILPLLVLLLIRFWGHGIQTEVITSQDASYQELQQNRGNEHYQDFKILTAKEFPAIHFTERAADSQEMVVRGRSENIQALITFVQALENSSQSRAVTILEAEKQGEEESLSFVLVFS